MTYIYICIGFCLYLWLLHCAVYDSIILQIFQTFFKLPLELALTMNKIFKSFYFSMLLITGIRVLHLNWIWILCGTQIVNTNLHSLGMLASLPCTLILQLWPYLLKIYPLWDILMVTLSALSHWSLMKILIDSTPILWEFKLLWFRLLPLYFLVLV